VFATCNADRYGLSNWLGGKDIVAETIMKLEPLKISTIGNEATEKATEEAVKEAA